MSGTYYYLVDGTEQGPFSRAAIESLLKSGRLTGALFRTEDATWCTPEEMGFDQPPQGSPASVTDAYGFPTKDPDPRSPTSSRTSTVPPRTGSSAALGIGLALLAAVVGGGFWYTSSGTSATPAGTSNPQSDRSDRSDRIVSTVDSMFTGSGEATLCSTNGCNHKIEWANGFGQLVIIGVGPIGGGVLRSFGSVESKCATFETGERNITHAGLCIATRDTKYRNSKMPGNISAGETYGTLDLGGVQTDYRIQGASAPADNGAPIAHERSSQSGASAAEERGSQELEEAEVPPLRNQDQAAARLPDASVAPEAIFVDAVALTMSPPAYPEAEKEGEVEGSTLLTVEIDVDGTVSNVEVKRSSRNRNFDRAAIAAAMEWTFSPATLNGVPVHTTSTIPVDFNITR